ncbi:hypothetical protein TanjilG_22004 [Lupinus angustifolius]|uniref:J domain-containing protein n=2 Tax=Lupinus angustifolius TaxID=3871 RepID=A0A4P1QTK0_LUPAN|nr:hypothetical protein TanjilG_22004 [Lupinus angustifolius]
MAHSRQTNKVPVTLSNKTLYDDVYGGPPPKFAVSNLSPRFEDYAEIFGSYHTHRASSIPLLDLPVVDETDAFFDPRSSVFNYTEVFGSLDFANSYEDLVDRHWTPAETDSFSGESDHPVNNQSISNRDLFQSMNGSTEFNISYHKVNGSGNEHMLKGRTTHMDQLHDVSGFTQVYDEPARLNRNGPSFQVTDDIDLDTEFTADKVKGNQTRKKLPNLHNFTSGEQTFSSDLNPSLHNGCGRNDSNSSEMFITVSDISLRSIPSQVPPPSRSPPVLDAKKGDNHGFLSNSGRVASEETPGDCSPPFFDVEVDTNSSAAPYIYAMQEAMHRAEAKIRGAKEIKERKKGANGSRVKSRFDADNNDAKMTKNLTRLNSLNNELVQETYDRNNSKMEISVTDERQNFRQGSTETLHTLEGKMSLNTLEVKNTKESMSFQESDRSTGVATWKEETELFELVGTEDFDKVIHPTKHTKILVQDTRTVEHAWKERESSITQDKYRKAKAIEENHHVEESGGKSIEVREEVNIRRSKASNEEHRQIKQEENVKNRTTVQHGKVEKTVSEAESGSLEDVSEAQHKEHKQVGNEKSKERQTPSEVLLGVRLKETEDKLQGAEKQRQSVKSQQQFVKMKESGKRQLETFPIGQAGDEENLKDSLEPEGIDERSNETFKQDNAGEKGVCRREEIEKAPKGFSKNKESDKGRKHGLRWEEIEKLLKEDFELEGNQIRMEEAFRRRENNERGKLEFERDQNQKKVKALFDGYGEGNRLKEAGDKEGNQKVLNQASEKEWNCGILNEDQRKEEIKSSSNQIFDREESVGVSNGDSSLELSETMIKDVGRKEKDKGINKALDEIVRNEDGENAKFAEATDETLEIESDEEIRAPEMTPGDTQHSVYQSGKVGECVKKVDDRNNIEAAESATVQESANVQKTAQGLHVGQSTERKENSLNESSATVVKDAERMRREIESEKDRLTQIEEDMEREREREKDRRAVDKATLEAEREKEREKDRMAVDRATFEARDRAYAETCERAERAAFERPTAEARQRALTEARERLQKACDEARSYADKATTEVRLKAERAAIERATGEAQEFAMEKLTAERAAFESRERLERSVSDKFGVCSSDMLDQQFQNNSSSMGSKYPHLLYGASSFSERSEREGESAQRCRARLERHRRTAERAAKALAEKNMWDLLVQKEQAERNRLAETLDAEVRRWSSGKQGNLRALLSTLQYILGPDCAWQPIPLTEVITSAAVKKAYRKATLCVHPDKLQQRGASIQHKYICEKVFDLLKEAWNKFNSEER